MLKLVLVSALVASAAALTTFGSSRQYPKPIYPTPLPTYKPLPQPSYNPQSYGKYIAILRSESDIAPDGSQYHYAYDTENGISAQESGSLVGVGTESAIAAVGSFQYTSPEGVPVQIAYTADANGFQPSGNVLPTPPPVPVAIQRSLAYNAAHPASPTAYPYDRKYYK